jgi:F-type H+-transporting ATPase subunit epsilon
MAGTDLARLRDSVEKDFRKLDTREEAARTAMAKLETGFLRRFARLHGE